MQAIAPGALFALIAAVTAGFSMFVLYRQRRRAALPSEEQATFVPLPTTTPVAARLDPRAVNGVAGSTTEAA
jgi:hypothetical protein